MPQTNKNNTRAANQWFCGRSWEAYLPGLCSAQREIGGDGSSQGHRRGEGICTDTLREHSTVLGQIETRVETETHIRFNWNFLPSSLFPWESNRINLLPVLVLVLVLLLLLWLLLLFQWMLYHRVASPCLWVVFDWSGSLVKLWVSTDHSACTCQSAKTTLEERLSEKNEAHPQLHDLTRLLDRVLVKAMCTTSASSTLHQCRCMHFSQRKWLSECLQENGDSFQVISDLRRELHKLEVQRLAPRLSSWRMLAVRKCKVQVQ